MYQLRIVLRGISPLIWRRVLVWSDITLSRLHAILQIVFARSDEHIQFPHPHVLSEGSSGNIAGGAVVGSKWPCLPETRWVQTSPSTF